MDESWTQIDFFLPSRVSNIFVTSPDWTTAAITATMGKITAALILALWLFPHWNVTTKNNDFYIGSWKMSDKQVECYQLNSGMKALFIPAVNKVPGYWLKGLIGLANKPQTMQIFPHSKFEINLTAGLKVMAKNLFWTQNNFLVITFKPVNRLIPNFECDKICMVGAGLFANAIKPLS